MSQNESYMYITDHILPGVYYLNLYNSKRKAKEAIGAYSLDYWLADQAVQFAKKHQIYRIKVPHDIAAVFIDKLREKEAFYFGERKIEIEMLD